MLRSESGMWVRCLRWGWGVVGDCVVFIVRGRQRVDGWVEPVAGEELIQARAEGVDLEADGGAQPEPDLRRHRLHRRGSVSGSQDPATPVCFTWRYIPLHDSLANEFSASRRISESALLKSRTR
jgi:hypothetical protein